MPGYYTRCHSLRCRRTQKSSCTHHHCDLRWNGFALFKGSKSNWRTNWPTNLSISIMARCRPIQTLGPYPN